ncbi:hypothetical protein CROQUDRAFT_108618 [Cronartium quercuum f. sp. fusiforme G11]|uniref:C2H2-type domain-containing protein n=1 Tax=Cronartium quercuum f. sp. fusiforme G11 TaxID=708437 RepID=A0A9P6NE28_9BASI|nr:hypothetical protein CROQUDRAFT_108618 [Cronartium quercuum f. sp. fusiforme G11]
MKDIIKPGASSDRICAQVDNTEEVLCHTQGSQLIGVRVLKQDTCAIESPLKGNARSSEKSFQIRTSSPLPHSEWTPNSPGFPPTPSSTLDKPNSFSGIWDSMCSPPFLDRMDEQYHLSEPSFLTKTLSLCQQSRSIFTAWSPDQHVDSKGSSSVGELTVSPKEAFLDYDDVSSRLEGEAIRRASHSKNGNIGVQSQVGFREVNHEQLCPSAYPSPEVLSNLVPESLTQPPLPFKKTLLETNLQTELPPNSKSNSVSHVKKSTPELTSSFDLPPHCVPKNAVRWMSKTASHRPALMSHGQETTSGPRNNQTHPSGDQLGSFNKHSPLSKGGNKLPEMSFKPWSNSNLNAVQSICEATEHKKFLNVNADDFSPESDEDLTPPPSSIPQDTSQDSDRSDHGLRPLSSAQNKLHSHSNERNDKGLSVILSQDHSNVSNLNLDQMDTRGETLPTNICHIRDHHPKRDVSKLSRKLMSKYHRRHSISEPRPSAVLELEVSSSGNVDDQYFGCVSRTKSKRTWSTSDCQKNRKDGRQSSLEGTGSNLGMHIPSAIRPDLSFSRKHKKVTKTWDGRTLFPPRERKLSEPASSMHPASRDPSQSPPIEENLLVVSGKVTEVEDEIPQSIKGGQTLDNKYVELKEDFVGDEDAFSHQKRRSKRRRTGSIKKSNHPSVLQTTSSGTSEIGLNVPNGQLSGSGKCARPHNRSVASTEQADSFKTHQAHQSNHLVGSIRCDHVDKSTGVTCDTVFRRPYDLARHKETIHDQGGPGNSRKPQWICKKCNGGFSRKDALIRHRRIRNH